MVSITLDRRSSKCATCECSLPPTRGNMCSHLSSNYVQAMCNFLQAMCNLVEAMCNLVEAVCNLIKAVCDFVQSLASSPVQMCQRMIPWREMLLAIPVILRPVMIILTQGIKRLRFVIFAIHGLPVSWEPKSQWAMNGGTWVRVELVNIGFCVQNVYNYVQLCARCLQLCASWCRSTLAPVEQISLCPQAICLPAIFSHQGANQITPSQINNSAWHLIN